MLKGCDISHWQGKPDFVKLNSNTDFVIIKASEGISFTDPEFQRNREEARKKGMLRGFYHFARPDKYAPEAEADWFLKVVGTPDEFDLFALDFEVTYPEPVDWCLRFLKRFSGSLSGYKPLLYMSLALNNAFEWSPVVNENYGLWLARWDYNPDAPAPKTDWGITAMRQYSNRIRVDGISGDVDGDVFYGDRSTFEKYGFKHKYSEPTPTPPEVPDVINDDQTLINIDGNFGILKLHQIRSTMEDQKRDLTICQRGTQIAVDNAKEQVKTVYEGKLADKEEECQKSLLEMKVKYEKMLLKNVKDYSLGQFISLKLKNLFPKRG